MEKVSAVLCSTYELEEVYRAVKESFAWIGFELPENKTVLIKPNLMGQNRPDQHTITHYALIDALCRILSEHHCRILIGDSSAFYQKGMTVRAFQTARFSEVAEKYDASLIPFEKEELVRVDSGLKGLQELYIPKVLLDVDMVINACKLKTHGALRLSGALKNMFGCLPGGYKQKIHMWTRNEFELSEVFLDIHQIIKPAVSIMDAVYSLDGGPSAMGTPVKTSRIFASANAAALDAVACRMIGYEPQDISTLICALNRHMISSYDDIEISGSIVPVKFKHINKDPLELDRGKDSIFVTDTYVYPAIDLSRCTVCGHCIDICPVKAIAVRQDKVEVNKKQCINCYRCLYECPENAIEVSAPAMNKFMRAGRKILRL